MATYLDALKSINAYPIPLRTIMEIAVERRLTLTAEATADELKAKPYQLAKADVLLWLSLAPNITQGGQSYSFSDEQRADMQSTAQRIYNEFEPDAPAVGVTYGYKGDRL